MINIPMLTRGALNTQSFMNGGWQTQRNPNNNYNPNNLLASLRGQNQPMQGQGQWQGQGQSQPMQSQWQNQQVQGQGQWNQAQGQPVQGQWQGQQVQSQWQGQTQPQAPTQGWQQPPQNTAQQFTGGQPVTQQPFVPSQQWGQGQPIQQPQQSQPMQGSYQQAPMQQRQRSLGNGVQLKKGQKTSLSRMCPGLDLIQVGLGWDLAPNGAGYDLDVEAFMLGNNGMVVGDDWFVFYNQPESPDGSVRLLCDSTNGAGDGDDEIIQVQLSKVNPSVSKLVFIVSINEAKQYGYNFSNVANAYVRIVDVKTNRELVRFQLTDYYSNVNSMVVGEVYLHNGEWKFNPIGDGVNADLEDLCRRYGVNLM